MLDDAPEWSPDEAEMIDLEEQDIAARRKAIHEALKTGTPKQKAPTPVSLSAMRTNTAGCTSAAGGFDWVSVWLIR